MALGDRGDAVREEQQRLNDLGADLVVDGIWGPKTQAAFEKYSAKPADEPATTPAPSDGSPPDYTPDNTQGRFHVIGGNPMIWKNTDTGTYLVVYFVPNSEPPLPIYWEVPDEETLQSYFGPDTTPVADREVTNDQLVSYGALGQGASTEMPATDQDPLASWAEIYERQAKVRPYLNDTEVIGMIMGAAIEGRTVTQAELESTNWWQSHTQGEREWLIKAEADPLSAEQEMTSNWARVREDLKMAGIDNPPEDLVDFLTNQYTTGLWSENMLISQVAALSDPYSVHKMLPDTAAFMSGVDSIDTTRKEEDTVRDLLTTWLGPMFGQWSEADIAAKAGQLRGNPDAEIEFIEYLKDQRMALFPNYGDRNVSYQSAMQPWKTFTQSAWGVPVDEMDETFQKIVQMNDPEEASKLLRKTGFERGYDQVVNDVSNGIKTGMNSNVRGAV